MTNQPSTHLINAVRKLAYTAEGARIEQASVPTSWALPELTAARITAVQAQRWTRQKYPHYDQRLPN